MNGVSPSGSRSIAESQAEVPQVNEDLGLEWRFSFLSADKRNTYCRYQAPDPEFIREARGGQGRLVVLLGERGIGKTRRAPESGRPIERGNDEKGLARLSQLLEIAGAQTCLGNWN